MLCQVAAACYQEVLTRQQTQATIQPLMHQAEVNTQLLLSLMMIEALWQNTQHTNRMP
jgi:hypothetical protein